MTRVSAALLLSFPLLTKYTNFIKDKGQKGASRTEERAWGTAATELWEPETASLLSSLHI